MHNYNNQRAPFLFEREKKLIALLGAIGEPVRPTDFQKLLFLYMQEQDSPRRSNTVNRYEFVPYQYGAYSFTSLHDRRRLHGKGIVDSDEGHWALTHYGQNLLAEYMTEFDTSFAIRYQNIRGSSLLKQTYLRYPYYAINSKIKDMLLRDHPDVLEHIETLKSHTLGPNLCTIGYEGRSIEEYLNCMLSNSIDVLVDVRRNPISRRYGFSRKTLRNACENLEITYIHIPELGIESEARKNLHDAIDYYQVFDEYRTRLIKQEGDSLRKIISYLHNCENVAITCFEKNPRNCHRHIITELLVDSLNSASRTGSHITAHHKRLVDLNVTHI